MFVEIKTSLHRYMENNEKMIHDYIHFTIQDLLDKNGEVYLIEDDIRGNEPVKNMLRGFTPDFIVKSNESRGRSRPMVCDIYVGKGDNAKSKYKFMEFFADVIEITPYNMSRVLKSVLPQSDVEYLFKNYQVFMTEYAYWHACIKLGKVLHNDIENVDRFAPPRKEPLQTVAKQQFAQNLASYADAVISRRGL